jgi:hypothetical protein
MLARPPDAAGSDMVPSMDLMGLIQELVDQIRPDSDLDLLRASLDRGKLCRVIGVKVMLLGTQAFHQILCKHNDFLCLRHSTTLQQRHFPILWPRKAKFVFVIFSDFCDS